MREKYESLSVTILRDLAKAREIKGASSMKKAELVEAMLAQDEIDKQKAEKEQPKEKPAKAEKAEKNEKADKADRAERVERVERTDRAEKSEKNEKIPADIPTDNLIYASGILEVMGDGFGFIRCDNYMPGTEDVYVSQSQIKKFNLKTGDIIVGKKRFNNPTDKFAALMIIDTINGYTPDAATKRPNFEDLTPIFPNERIRLERQRSSVAMRIVDLVSPIGKGQRGMIVSQPKAGKTTLLKEVATSVNYSHPDMHLIILLIDERPEEVTDMKDTMRNSKNVEVIYSTFDESPEHHKRVSEMVIERAKRLVEHGRDVMILLDSITRLARAYNLTVQPSGRTLSGGLDPAALHMPKKFFGAARNMREGGSLTILATALVDTGSKMDDVVFEEFKGTGNMELILDRKLSEKRIFPAIDITGSGTRREDLLLSRKELDAMEIMRKAINGARKEDAVETILNMFAHTKNNDEYIDMVIRKRVI
ncbi:MAG: transcription termination factor Rho [Pseudobutyrivibrio ruminis]|nr:transcription termination factor Rho [Pseudobutyrivibrio ruminis]